MIRPRLRSINSRMLFRRTVPLNLDAADSLKSCSFKKRIHLPHLRHRFNPGPLATLATEPHKPTRQTCSPILRHNHHPRQRDQLPIQCPATQLAATSRQPKEFSPQAQRKSRRAEHTNPNWLLPVPQQRHILDEADVMRSIMPPSKIRPVDSGRFTGPDLPGKTDPFFFTFSSR